MQPKVSDTDSDATHTTYRHVYDRHVCILSRQLVGCNTPFLWGQILWDANFFLTENERHTGETSEKYLVACGVHYVGCIIRHLIYDVLLLGSIDPDHNHTSGTS